MSQRIAPQKTRMIDFKGHRFEKGPVGAKLQFEAVWPPKTHSCQSISALQFRESVLRGILGCTQVDFDPLSQPPGNGRFQEIVSQRLVEKGISFQMASNCSFASTGPNLSKVQWMTSIGWQTAGSHPTNWLFVGGLGTKPLD